MTDENVQILTDLNFRKIDINWVGKIDNYFFDVLDKQDSEDQLVISFIFAPNENKSKIFEYLDVLQSEKVISDYELNKNTITINFLESGTEKLNIFLKKIADNLNNIGMECKCSNCDNTNDLNFYTNGSVSLLLCNDCANDVKTKLAEEEKRSSYYVKGFFASLIGALIGSIVWIILGAIGFIASIAGLAIAYCAFFGYSRFGGKVSKTGVILTVFSIVIAFLFAEYIGLGIDFIKAVDGATMLDYIFYTPVILSDVELIKSILPDLGFGVLFAFLGSNRTIRDNLNRAKAGTGFSFEKIDFTESQN